MAELGVSVGDRVRVKPARPFAGREAEVRDVSATRVRVYLLPNGPEVDMLPRDIEPITPKQQAA
ncbi:MAG TPA: hypothetical protein G4O02_03540 [Caldilineae bacterium]|nr:hypothetical protein [Caldilineae bacterium]